MNIDITEFFNTAAPMDYSASIAEIGNNAGQDTWRAACEDAPDWNFLDNEDKREAFRDFVKYSGGWTEEEIQKWSAMELNALFLQWISGNIREGFEWDVDDIWANYEELSSAGTVPSNIFRGDDGRIYFYIGE